MADHQAVISVINPAASKRYKVTLRGDFSRLPVRKLKQYLVPSCGIPAEYQKLKHNGVELGDEIVAGEVGIAHGSTLLVERIDADNKFVASPIKQALEADTLQQQRARLQQDRLAREDEGRQQQAALAAASSQAAARQGELEKDKAQREAEIARLRDIQKQSNVEMARLEELRQRDAEREAARAKDLEARKEQLGAERAHNRQLEMLRLENERKKMLMLQQKQEFEAERERLESEKRARRERIKQHELQLKAREVDIDRTAMEAERGRRELELERAMLQQQRDAEVDQLTRGDRMALSGSGNEIVPLPGTPRSVFGGVPPRPAQYTPGRSTHRSTSVQQKERVLEELRAEREALENDLNTSREMDQAIALERRRMAELRGETPASTPAMTPSATPNTSAIHAAPVTNGAAPQPANSSALPQPMPLTGKVDAPRDLAADAQQQLRHLGEDLGLEELQLDPGSNTAAVTLAGENTLLLTYNEETERLYLYSTVLTHIPTDPTLRLRLYEALLEGSIIGRNACGGGVSVSLKTDHVLLATSIFLPTAAPDTLKEVTPKFIESLTQWRQTVREVLGESPGATSHDTPFTGDDVYVPKAAPVHGVDRSGSTRSLPTESMASQPLASQPPTPSAMARRSLRQSISGGPGGERPGLGIEAVQGETGVLVASVTGAASRAGILSNDIVRAVNHTPVSSLASFADAARGLRANKAAQVLVERAGAQLLVNVFVGGGSIAPALTN